MKNKDKVSWFSCDRKISVSGFNIEERKKRIMKLLNATAQSTLEHKRVVCPRRGRCDSGNYLLYKKKREREIKHRDP